MTRWTKWQNDFTGTIGFEARCNGGKATVKESAAHGGYWVASTLTRSGKGRSSMHRDPASGKRAALRRLGCGR